MDISGNKIREMRVLFAGGGTGGHLYPAIALAEEFQRRKEIEKFNPLFVGTQHGLEIKVIPEHGYKLKTIWISGFHRGRSLKILFSNLALPIKVLVSLIQSMKILSDFSPHLVVGTGGYAMAIPLLLATMRGVPAAIQEQNSYPGVVSRWLDTKVDMIFLGFEDSAGFFSNPAKRYYGNPLRGNFRKYPRDAACEHFGLEKDKRTVFIFGGSQGSRPINEYFLSMIDTYLNMNTQFIWQTGSLDYSRIKREMEGKNCVKVREYIREMDKAYSAADFCVCRAGALSIAELSMMSKPAILIPLPGAAADHQRHNAESLVKHDAARMVLQQEVYSEKMVNTMRELLESDEVLQRLSDNISKFARPDAARLIVNDLMELARA